MNLGPKADGTFCEEEMQILEKLSDWTAKNKEAIWGTQPYKIFGEGKNTAMAHLTKNIITLIRIIASHTKRVAFTYLH